MNPDKFNVGLVDHGNQIGLAFSVGDGEYRRRWGARLTPKMAAEIADALGTAVKAIKMYNAQASEADD